MGCVSGFVGCLVFRHFWFWSWWISAYFAWSCVVIIVESFCIFRYFVFILVICCTSNAIIVNFARCAIILLIKSTQLRNPTSVLVFKLIFIEFDCNTDNRRIIIVGNIRFPIIPMSIIFALIFPIFRPILPPILIPIPHFLKLPQI